jgi:hypothetical protein
MRVLIWWGRKVLEVIEYRAETACILTEGEPRRFYEVPLSELVVIR